MYMDDIRSWIIAGGVIATFIVGGAYGDPCLATSMLAIIVLMATCELIVNPQE